MNISMTPEQRLLIAVFGEPERNLRAVRSGGQTAVMNDALCQLQPREKQTLEMRFGFKQENDAGKTYRAIAEEFCVGKERIRWICERALRKLRHPKISRKLKLFYLEEI